MKRQKLGIDAGGSLIKIAIEDQNHFRYKKYPIGRINEAMTWLSIVAQDAEVRLTGGKADFLRQNYFPNARLELEFEATCQGAAYLLSQTRTKIGNKYLLVNIGTGTSWYLIEGLKNERIFGSGIGGGTFIGLGKIMTNRERFEELVKLAEEGNRRNVDLLVKDIYATDLAPIDGDLTASNFAKAGTSHVHNGSDRLAATLNMMAETIVLFSKQLTEIHQINEVVFIGSTLIGNLAFQSGLKDFAERVGLKPLFLQHGEYSGAIGSVLS